MLVRTLVNKVLFVCKRSVENYFTPYLANKVLFAKVRSSVYKCLAQIYTCCRLSSFGLTETAKYKFPYILYPTCFAEIAKRLRHKFRVAPPLHTTMYVMGVWDATSSECAGRAEVG